MEGKPTHEMPHKYTYGNGARNISLFRAFPTGKPLNITGYRGNRRDWKDIIKDKDGNEVINADFPVNSYKYNTELPTTSDEYGKALLPDFVQSSLFSTREPVPVVNEMSDDLSVPLPSVDLYPFTLPKVNDDLSYPLVQQVPYMGRMPQISPFGINHTITPEEFASYTIPGTYDASTNTFVEEPYPTFSDSEREGAQLFDRGARYYSGKENPVALMMHYKLPPRAEFMNQIKRTSDLESQKDNYLLDELAYLNNHIAKYNNYLKNSKDLKDKFPDLADYAKDKAEELALLVPVWKQRLQEIESGNLSDTDTAYTYDYIDDNTKWVRELFESNPELYDQFLKQRPFTGTKEQIEQQGLDQIVRALSVHKEPEKLLADKDFNIFDEVPESLKDKVKNPQYLRLLAKANGLWRKAGILARINKLKEQEAKSYRSQIELPLWILNHARRGINVVDGKLTPHAHLQGISQQKDPKTANTWNSLYGQVMRRLNQYRSNPRYLNVMKKWEVSPFGDDMLGYNSPMLTIEQMRQILEDLNQEDRNYEIENSPQFQGYGYDTVA